MDPDDLLAHIVSTTVTAAGRCASVSFVVPPEWVGRGQVLIRPYDQNAPTVRLTDTTVSLYLEFEGAHWEADSLDDAPFEDRSDWAIAHISHAADYGFVRVRRRGHWWGRQTHLLTSPLDGKRWFEDSRFVVVRSWPSWTGGYDVRGCRT